MRKRPRYGAIPKSCISPQMSQPKPKQKIPKAENNVENDVDSDAYVSNETLPLEILLKKALTLVRA